MTISKAALLAVDSVSPRQKRSVSFHADHHAPERVAVHQKVEAIAGAKRKSSMLTSVCLMVQSIMGGGLLTFPHAYMAGGIWNMVVLQLAFMPFIALSLWVLAWCTDRTDAETYQAMVRKSLGRTAEVLCVLCIVILVFGASVVYLDVLVDQVHPWLVEAAQFCAAGDGSVASVGSCGVAALRLDNRTVLTLAMAAVLSLLCLGRSMAALSIPSLLGFVALIYVSIMIVANGALAAESGDLAGAGAGAGAWAGVASEQAGVASEQAAGPVAWWRSGAQQWMSMIPVICFSYQGHISAVPLYSELHYRSTARWLKVIAMALTTCVVLYNAAGFMGYLQFLDATQSDILNSFMAQPETVFLPSGCLTAARAAISAAVSVTCAVFTFCARSAVLDELSIFMEGSPRVGPVSSGVWLSVTYTWLGAVAAVAICVPDIGAVVAVAGNFSAFFMFHFPGLMLLAAAREEDTSDNICRKPSLRVLDALPKIDDRKFLMAALGWIFIVIGTAVFVLGLSSALYNL